jgi:hypothetical protein
MIKNQIKLIDIKVDGNHDYFFCEIAVRDKNYKNVPVGVNPKWEKEEHSKERLKKIELKDLSLFSPHKKYKEIIKNYFELSKDKHGNYSEKDQNKIRVELKKLHIYLYKLVNSQFENELYYY